MTDPVLAQRLMAFRTSGDPPPWTPYLQCDTFQSSEGGPRKSAASVVLVFRGGRLTGAYQPIYPAPPPPPYTDRKATMAYIRRPVTSPYLANFGELPLEDGLGFLSRLARTELAPNDELGADCKPAPPPPPPHKAPHHGLDAGDMQGLALLPFAVSLPGMNQQRVAARRTGAALLASLRVGEMLPAAPRNSPPVSGRPKLSGRTRRLRRPDHRHGRLSRPQPHQLQQIHTRRRARRTYPVDLAAGLLRADRQPALFGRPRRPQHAAARLHRLGPVFALTPVRLG